MFAVGASSWCRTMAILRVALREKVEGTLWAVRSSTLVWRHWSLRNSRSILALNSNRWRMFEDARLEIVMYVEAKFGLIIRVSRPSEAGARGPSDPMEVDAINSLASGTRIIWSPRDWKPFSQIAFITSHHAKAMTMLAKEKNTEGNGDGQSKRKSKGSWSALGSYKEDGWSCDEWNDDWSSVGWHEVWEEPHVTSAGSLSLEVLISCVSSFSFSM